MTRFGVGCSANELPIMKKKEIVRFLPRFDTRLLSSSRSHKVSPSRVLKDKSLANYHFHGP